MASKRSLVRTTAGRTAKRRKIAEKEKEEEEGAWVRSMGRAMALGLSAGR